MESVGHPSVSCFFVVKFWANSNFIEKYIFLSRNLPRAMKVSLREEKMYSKNGELIPSLNSREIDILKDLNALNSDNKG